MAEEKDMAERTDIERIADLMTEAERSIVKAVRDLGAVVECVDAAARDLNNSGADVRACDLGEWDFRFGEIIDKLCEASAATKMMHCELIEKVEELAIPLPRPRSGGR